MPAIDIARWLDELGLGDYGQNFIDGDVDGEVLPHLTVDDLRELGVVSVGHRRKILAAIEALKDPEGAPAAGEAETGAAADSFVERRHMTIMFCDLVGSTAMSARLDPEQTQEVIANYYDCVGDILGQYGGYVAKFLGDGVLAYFGYPKAQEDAALRSVMAASKIARAVPELREPDGRSLACRIGIASGLVVVGDLLQAGSKDTASVFGETPNLAARLQTVAEVGGIVVSDTTARLVGDRVSLESLGEVALKGLGHAVLVYRVADTEITEDRARRTDRATPFVNRTAEIALLERLQQGLGSGRGRGILISGDAGLGKSRLTREFVEQSAGAQPVLQFQCSPYHGDSPFHPFLGELFQAAGIDGASAPAVVRNRLQSCLSAQGTNDPSVADAFADLLGQGPAPAPAEARRRRDLVIASLVTRVQHASRSASPIVLFEDLHWIDPSSLTVLDRLLQSLESWPLLVLMTARSPEPLDRMDSADSVERLEIGPLDRGHTETIIRFAYGDGPSSDNLIDRLTERADGVPIFAEELARDAAQLARLDGDRVADAAALEQMQIPESLQESLQWRIDRLQFGREPLRVAAFHRANSNQLRRWENTGVRIPDERVLVQLL